MFYSHTYLARKGPLGTVWCAAHLQHKLKKSHYTSTHIPSTVERIMCPEVPIALRMSGHLLLGVVRIYSKKVDYLHHDCNLLWVTLRNAFRPVDVNLPDNATHAPLAAITLPETFQLDAIDIDPLDHPDWTNGHHLKTQEEITLQDQNSFQGEFYVRITLDDDGTPSLSPRQTSQHREDEQMQIDTEPQDQSPASIRNQDVGPSMQTGDGNDRFGEGSSLPDIPMDIEVLRDCPESDIPIIQPEDILDPEPNKSPLHMISEKDPQTPSVEHQHLSGAEVPVLRSTQRSGPSSRPTDGGPALSGSFANASLEDLVIRPSPTPEKPPPKRQRKRKQLYDEALVLTNEYLKNALNDCSNLVKKRKKLPCSSLEMWRFMNNKKKEQIFLDPLISGMCADLQNISSKDLSSLQSESRVPESSVIPTVGVTVEEVQSPNHDHVPDFGDTERLRSADVDPVHDLRDELNLSPMPNTPPHSGENAQSFSSPRIPDSVSEQSGNAFHTEPHGDTGMYSSHTGSGMITPVTDFEGGIDDFGTALSDIPELRNSIASDDLSFLEQDNDNPPDSVGPREGDTMSARTRAVAQYLRDHSPLSKFSDKSIEDLSLNNILEGRSRKLCARMFFETLVLKDYGLIDVQQDEPYGDITLKLTPTFSKATI